MIKQSSGRFVDQPHDRNPANSTPRSFGQPHLNEAAAEFVSNSRGSTTASSGDGLDHCANRGHQGNVTSDTPEENAHTDNNRCSPKNWTASSDGDCRDHCDSQRQLEKDSFDEGVNDFTAVSVGDG